MGSRWIKRLYDGEGHHILSLVPCGTFHDGTVNYNLEFPDGRVVVMGIHENSIKNLG